MSPFLSELRSRLLVREGVTKSNLQKVCVNVCVRVYVCVCERESLCVTSHISAAYNASCGGCVCVCVYVCVCVRERVFV